MSLCLRCVPHALPSGTSVRPTRLAHQTRTFRLQIRRRPAPPPLPPRRPKLRPVSRRGALRQSLKTFFGLRATLAVRDASS
ncbi:hypothetical protein EVAR_3341_1 [Eumeta japonica]|uniref:Uncharacterized protein n=1 Tax=Eumeta variegata TaxID=151549 RepID=A0A4C1SSQ2_EUMVA|nr:hypothetical protein EVAR_3341_1 [Eumeta japonica]